MPILGFFMLSMINSCSKSKNFSDIKFPETVSLIGEERAMPDVYLKYPFRVRLNDTSLYVMDIHPADYYCHEFAYPSMKYKRSFAKRGEAPDEFLDAENIRFDNQNRLWVLDANRKKIVRFDEGDTAGSQEDTPLDENLIRTLDFDLLDDSTFIVPDYTGRHRLTIVDANGKATRHLFTIPIIGGVHGDASTIPIAQAWRSFLDYDAQRGIVAVATQLGQVLEIYDTQNERVVNIVKPEGMEPRFVTKGNYSVPTGIMGYSDIHIGEEYIYAIFWGHSFDDIKQQKHTEEGGKYIHVFDLEGNPVRQYLLDRYITGFHVDEKNKVIIGLDVNSDQPIVAYAYETTDCF